MPLAGGAGATGAGKLAFLSNWLVEVLILCLAGADPLSALTGALGGGMRLNSTPSPFLTCI
jgi:hypothetical protein